MVDRLQTLEDKKTNECINNNENFDIYELYVRTGWPFDFSQANWTVSFRIYVTVEQIFSSFG